MKEEKKCIEEKKMYRRKKKCIEEKKKCGSSTESLIHTKKTSVMEMKSSYVPCIRTNVLT